MPPPPIVPLPPAGATLSDDVASDMRTINAMIKSSSDHESASASAGPAASASAAGASSSSSGQPPPFGAGASGGVPDHRFRQGPDHPNAMPIQPSSSSECGALLVLPLAAAALTAIAVVLLVAWIFYPAYVARKKGGGAGGGDATEEVITGRAAANSGVTPMLTLVIPAYNEEERLPVMLDATLDHLRLHRRDVIAQCRAALGSSTATASKSSSSRGGRRSTSKARAKSGGAAEVAATDDLIEIIVVSDGSTDSTCSLVRSYADAVLRCHPSRNDVLKLVSLRRNSGKGAAVRAGVLRSAGRLVLMVDADGATEFGEGLSRVLGTMEGQVKRRRHFKGGSPRKKEEGVEPPAAAVFGSRAHLEDASGATRSVLRTFLMRCFHLCVRTLCSSEIRDTQCGFKLFTRPAALSLFANLHLTRWAFDTELVVMAQRLGVNVVEVGVPWHEVDGSKIDSNKFVLAWNSLGMLRDMICVRACYTFGIWTLKMR